MSNSLAIAAVTSVIQFMLQTYGKINVTTKSPDQAATDAQGARINLFLYHTMPNPTWRNLDMPGRVGPGERGNPPLALNLHYLLTAYGEDGSDLIDQRTLGTAMQVLHDRPVLKRSLIEDVLPQDLLASGLHEQVEHIRIIPDTLNIEEMSRLWQTFQTQYRVSAAYQASVVLIESSRQTSSALPVAKRGAADRGVLTNVGLDAVLEGIEYRAASDQPALPAAKVNSTIIVVGSNLPAVGATIVVRDPKLPNQNGLPDSDIVARLTPEIETAGKRLRVKLSEDQGSWPVGMLALELQFRKDDDSNGRIVSSNSVALALSPEIQTSAVDKLAVAFVQEQGDKRILSVSLVHPLGNNRRVLLILNRYIEPDPTGATPTSTPRPQSSFFQLPRLPDTQGLGNLNPSFDVSIVTPGKYWIRLRVDGIDSLVMNLVQDSERNRLVVEFDETQKVEI